LKTNNQTKTIDTTKTVATLVDRLFATHYMYNIVTLSCVFAGDNNINIPFYMWFHAFNFFEACFL